MTVKLHYMVKNKYGVVCSHYYVYLFFIIFNFGIGQEEPADHRKVFSNPPMIPR